MKKAVLEVLSVTLCSLPTKRDKLCEFLIICYTEQHRENNNVILNF